VALVHRTADRGLVMPSFFQQVLQQTRPAAARPSPQPACYAQLRSNAAACPPFIMRRTIQPDLRMRRTDEAFDLEVDEPVT
jgi:hypothetical protein